jgi:putative spermidine/putrescine transport system substrate-binding protein
LKKEGNMGAKAYKLVMIAVLLIMIITSNAGLVLAAKSGEVRVAVTGSTYLWVQTWAEDFEKDSGLKLILAKKYLSGAKLKAMGMANMIDFDVVQSNINSIEVGVREKVMVPVDYSVFTKEQYQDISMRKDFVNSHGVAVIAFGRGMAYSLKKYPGGVGHPKSWQEFWDVEKFPGRRSLSFAWNYPPWEGALLADGADINDLYPVDLKRALGSFDKIRKHVVKFAMSSAETVQLLVTGEVDMVDGWYGSLLKAAQKGAPIGIEYNQAEFAFNMLSPLKGPNGLENSMTFIKYAMKPEIQARMAYDGLGPISIKALKILPKELAKTLPTHPDNISKMFIRNGKWWSDMTDKGKTNREMSIEMLQNWMVE